MSICLFGAVTVAEATTIDFEAQAAGAGSVFTGAVNSPLVIGIATFTGGQLLKNETASVDLTGVYATTNLIAGAYTNPLVITFSAPVSAFSIEVTNNFADTYTVADNVGDTSSLLLPALAQQVFSLNGVGITSVTIAATNRASFDFAIDNVQFTAAAVPEPATLTLTALGLAAFVRRRRRR